MCENQGYVFKHDTHFFLAIGFSGFKGFNFFFGLGRMPKDDSQLQKKDLVESLKLEIEYCEENLKEAMQHLDEINEEVVFLTKEYHLLLKELTNLTKGKE